MSIDLAIDNAINTTPQAIEDQDGNQSGLYIATGSANLPVGTQLVFGIQGHGIGEWITNSKADNSEFGIAFYGASQERARLTNQGSLGIGTATPTATLHVAGSARIEQLPSGPGTDVVADASGNLQVQASSARFKENVRRLREDFSKILSLEPVSFRYRGGETEDIGYLAEEVAEQGLEPLVVRDTEGQPFSVSYKLIPVYLVELAKRQQALIDELQERLDELHERFDRLQPAAAT
jgi:hypothetical protein